MGLYQKIRETWNDGPKELLKSRLPEWRKDPTVMRIERPTRIDKARSVGYKAKKGFIIVRVKLLRGGRTRPKPSGGRVPSKLTRRKVVTLNYQKIAEERANRNFKNCEVLNSYYVAKDGKYGWYEVILVDRQLVSKYKGYEWLAGRSNKGRVYRGKTLAGRRSRGLLKKGKGTEKLRPGRRAVSKRKYRITH
jgi:large subunit ribosomal protein L15e